MIHRTCNWISQLGNQLSSLTNHYENIDAENRNSRYLNKITLRDILYTFDRVSITDIYTRRSFNYSNRPTHLFGTPDDIYARWSRHLSHYSLSLATLKTRTSAKYLCPIFILGSHEIRVRTMTTRHNERKNARSYSWRRDCRDRLTIAIWYPADAHMCERFIRRWLIEIKRDNTWRSFDGSRSTRLSH